MGQSNSTSSKKVEIGALDHTPHFDDSELQSLAKQYQKENPSGTIAKEEFIEAMEQMGVVDTFLQNTLFNVFDANADGEISFSEFVQALSIMTRGTPNEKLRFAFKMYDIDHSGYVSRDDMLQVLEAFARMVGPGDENPLTSVGGKKYDSPQELVDDLFGQMDTNEDGKISFEEYQVGAMKNTDIMKGLKLYSA
eukprot:TRINITY_DN558_c0_g1_i1.p1 TRINITY_DN558_c0_g1~~TRINITY_DN558_c0_g1_i1.p1  ORF type:complete len:194 (-),score=74.67 TRINITY_DN558_c0_g1_i1:477-1058(-)